MPHASARATHRRSLSGGNLVTFASLPMFVMLIIVTNSLPDERT